MVLARSLTLPTVAVVAGLGCAGPGDRAAPDGVDAAVTLDSAVADTVAGPAEGFEPVALPPDFPADFPLPPRSAVTSAASQVDADGTFTNVTIVTDADPVAGLEWYRDALTRGGWTVAIDGTADGATPLHAELGESYVDLTVGPDPATGGTRAEAAIWKIHP